MHHRRVSSRILAVLIAMLALATGIAPAAVAAADDPEVRSMVSQDPRTLTDDPDPQAFATLRLPTGGWVARVVARWDLVSDEDEAIIVCWTTIVGGGELDRHTVRTHTRSPYYDAYPLTGQVTDSMAMSAAANVTAPSGGRVEVRCSNEGDDLVVLREIRIVALRAGRLTIISPSGTSESGHGAPHVLQLRGTQSRRVSVTETTEPVASLDLGPGAWWVSAVLSLKVGPNGSYNYPVNWRCRLQLGHMVDRVGGALESDMLLTNRTTATMDGAARITSKAPVRLGCGVSEEWPDLRMAGLRIMAVQVGTLVEGDGSEDATWSSSGKGLPRVVHAHLAESAPIADDAFVVVARVPLTSGRWLVTAKYGNDRDVIEPFPDAGPFPRLLCELRLGGGTSGRKTTTRAYGPGVPLQLVADLRGGTLWLRCRWDAEPFPVTRLHEVRITAVRVD